LKIDQIGIVVPPYDDLVPRPGVPLALGLTKGPVDPLPALSLIWDPEIGSSSRIFRPEFPNSDLSRLAIAKAITCTPNAEF